MGYNNRRNVNAQHIAVLVQKLGWQDVTSSHPNESQFVIQNDDNDIIFCNDIYALYRMLLLELSIRGNAP